jgi:hypothetical protein
MESLGFHPQEAPNTGVVLEKAKQGARTFLLARPYIALITLNVNDLI